MFAAYPKGKHHTWSKLPWEYCSGSGFLVSLPWPSNAQLLHKDRGTRLALSLGPTVFHVFLSEDVLYFDKNSKLPSIPTTEKCFKVPKMDTASPKAWRICLFISFLIQTLALATPLAIAGLEICCSSLRYFICKPIWWHRKAKRVKSFQTNGACAFHGFKHKSDDTTTK